MDLQGLRCPSGRRDGLEGLCQVSPVLPCGRVSSSLYAPALPGISSLQPAESDGCSPGSRLQHGGQLHDEHKLAGLCRRDDHEYHDADAGAHGSEFRFRGKRHGGARRLHPRACATASDDDRQLLGRHGPHGPLHTPAPLHRALDPASSPRVLCRHWRRRFM